MYESDSADKELYTAADDILKHYCQYFYVKNMTWMGWTIK